MDAETRARIDALRRAAANHRLAALYEDSPRRIREENEAADALEAGAAQLEEPFMSEPTQVPPKILVGQQLSRKGHVGHPGLCTGLIIEGREFIVLAASTDDLHWLWERIQSNEPKEPLLDGKIYHGAVIHMSGINAFTDLAEAQPTAHRYPHHHDPLGR